MSEKSSDEFTKLTQLVNLSTVTIKSYDFTSLKTETNCTLYLVAINAKETLEKLHKSKLKIFSSHSRILFILTNQEHFNKEIFYNTCFKNNLDLLIFHQNTQTNLFHTIEDVLNTSLYSVLQKRTLIEGKETQQNLTQLLSRPKWHPVCMVEKLNLTFNILGYARSPYVMGTDEEPSGFDVELIKLVLRDIPFKIKLVRDVNDPFGYMENVIKNGDSDMNLGALWLRYNLVQQDDKFTLPYYQQCLKLAVHKPILLPDSTFMFQYFQLSLWFMLFLVIGVVTVFVSLVELVTQSELPFGESFLVVISYFLGGSFEGNLSKGTVMDITFLFWSVCSLLIITYMNSGLTTLMQLPRFTQDINTFEEMIQMKIHWFFKIASMQKIVDSLGGIYSQVADLFIHSTDPVYVNKMVRTGQYGTIVESLPGRLLANIDILDEYSRKHLKVIDQCFLRNHLTFIVQKNSPYFDYINKKILEIVSFGFIDVLMRKLITTEQKRVSNMFYSYYVGEIRVILDLSRMQGAFWLLIFGWSVGICVFLWHLLKRKIRS